MKTSKHTRYNNDIYIRKGFKTKSYCYSINIIQVLYVIIQTLTVIMENETSNLKLCISMSSNKNNKHQKYILEILLNFKDSFLKFTEMSFFSHLNYQAVYHMKVCSVRKNSQSESASGNFWERQFSFSIVSYIP